MPIGYRGATVRKKADAAAIALVRAIAGRTDKPLPRMQTRILNYLVERGYVGNHGITRPELAEMAMHFGRSASLIRHEIVKLVDLGAVLRWQDEWKMPHYSFNPEWDALRVPEEDEEAHA